MPTTIPYQYVSDRESVMLGFEIATEDELLDFANRLRAAGDADPLDALLPSNPGKAQSCLVANALNFRSEVDHTGDPHPDRTDVRLPEYQWTIRFPANMAPERAEEIAGKVGLEPFEDRDFVDAKEFKLPRTIGNAAYAFDEVLAFQAYAQDVD